MVAGCETLGVAPFAAVRGCGRRNGDIEVVASERAMCGCRRKVVQTASERQSAINSNERRRGGVRRGSGYDGGGCQE